MSALTPQSPLPTDTPSSKQLRTFGLLMGGMIALMFGLIVPWIWGAERWWIWPFALAAVFIVWALAVPHTLGIVYRGWMKVALVLGWINTRLILGIAFTALFIPIGLLMRAARKDPMARRYDASADSYRITRHAREDNHMEKPY